MQIGARFQLHHCSLHASVGIFWRNLQNAIQNGGHLSKTPRVFITERDLLKDENVSWVQLERALKFPCRFFPAALSPIHKSRDQQHQRLVRQSASGKLELVSCSIVIAIAPVKMLRPRQMRFPRIWPNAKRIFDGGIRQSEAPRSVI